MVNSTPTPSSASPVIAAFQRNADVSHSSAIEDGCNDEPPPILSPPVGNAAGGVSNNLYVQQVPALTTCGEEAQSNSTHQEPKVYDYGYHAELAHTNGASTAAAFGSLDEIPGSVSGQSSSTAVDTATLEVQLSKSGDFDGTNPHTATPEAIAAFYNVDLKLGLTRSDAGARLEKYGLNKLQSDEGVKWWKVLLRQVSNSLTLVGSNFS